MSAFDGGKRNPGASAQMVHDVPAGMKPAARLRNFIVAGRRWVRSSLAVVVPMIPLFTCAAVFPAGDREDCADADHPDQKKTSCSRLISEEPEHPPQPG